jgi:hypothetical protein
MSGISSGKLYVVESDGTDAFPVGARFVVFEEKKPFWIVFIHGSCLKVMKSTGRFPSTPKGPKFSLTQPVEVEPLRENNDVIKSVTVTETQLDLIPQKRGRGRPATGKALTPAEKQARYRARKAQKTVTVTFNRDAVDALENHIRALAGGHDAPLSPDMLQSMLDSIRSATQTQLAQEAV